jgi:exocyst complex component 4
MDPTGPDAILLVICSICHIQEICGAAYRGLVQPDAEDKRIISAQWAKDEVPTFLP